MQKVLLLGEILRQIAFKISRKWQLFSPFFLQFKKIRLIFWKVNVDFKENLLNYNSLRSLLKPYIFHLFDSSHIRIIFLERKITPRLFHVEVTLWSPVTQFVGNLIFCTVRKGNIHHYLPLIQSYIASLRLYPIFVHMHHVVFVRFWPGKWVLEHAVMVILHWKSVLKSTAHIPCISYSCYLVYEYVNEYIICKWICNM